MTHSIPTHLRGSVWTGLSHYGVIAEGDADLNGRDLAEIADEWWGIAQHNSRWQEGLDDRQVRELLAILTEVAEYAIDNNYGAPEDADAFPEDVKFANQAEEIVAWFTDVAMTSALR